ncbi:MAG: alpha-hydroxy-acid oxidizing protein [Candidatus Obscuribacterales bacterium]|nr:alpha-hydroxy-acid oxidizing protein [Candidatus Obscuribacterales bacterium]
MLGTNVETPPVNLFDFEKIAAQRIHKLAFDYFASGANDEITLRENRQAYERLRLYPRMLRDVDNRTMEVSLLTGQKISMPVIIAPMAFQRMAHPDGELATISAATNAGTIMCLSTLSTCSIEEVASRSSGNLWFQLYVYRDRGITRSLVERAEAAGCKALVLTVDSPMLGRREPDVRNAFSLPEGITASNLLGANLHALPKMSDDSGLAAYIHTLYDQSLTWKDVEWLRSITNMPILVKGVLRPDDAELAVIHGAAGVVVSNHGGRQLDTVPATISVLEKIANQIHGKAELYVDGGVRRGTDILKALALGAKAVLLGRPILWGLGHSGQAGVELVLSLLRQELDLAMVLSGCASPREVTRDLVD